MALHSSKIRCFLLGRLWQGTISSYMGQVHVDHHYGRRVPAPSHGSINLEEPTSSTKRLMTAAKELFDKITDAKLLVRRITVTAAGVVPEQAYEIQRKQAQELDLFADPDIEQKEEQCKQSARKEKALQNTVLAIGNLCSCCIVESLVPGINSSKRIK